MVLFYFLTKFNMKYLRLSIILCIFADKYNDKLNELWEKKH